MSDPASPLSESLGDHRLAWIAPDLARTRGWSALGTPLVVVCADAMGLADGVGFPVLEIPPDTDTPSSALALLEHEETVEFLRTHGVTHLLTFKANKRLQERAEALGLALMMGEPSVAQRFENKVQFAVIARELGLAAARTRTGQGGLPSHAELSEELGPRYVLQTARGHSGLGTWCVDNEDDHRGAAQAVAHRGWRAMAWLEGTTWTLNACVDRAGNVFVGPVFRQLTGIPDCTPHPLGACGNAWGDANAPEALGDMADTLGGALHRAGYIGAFGVDAIDCGGTLHVIEVNPRVTSGLAMEAALSRAGGLPSVAEAHVRSHLGEIIPSERLAKSVAGSQLVLYTRSQEVTALQSNLPGGRYRLENGVCHRVDDCTDPSQTAADEAIVWTRTAHRPIPPNAEFGRIQSTAALVRSDSNGLSDLGSQWVRVLRKGCPVRP
jgi:hypothetical protein